MRFSDTGYDVTNMVFLLNLVPGIVFPLFCSQGKSFSLYLSTPITLTVTVSPTQNLGGIAGNLIP